MTVVKSVVVMEVEDFVEVEEVKGVKEVEESF